MARWRERAAAVLSAAPAHAAVPAPPPHAPPDRATVASVATVTVASPEKAGNLERFSLPDVNSTLDFGSVATVTVATVATDQGRPPATTTPTVASVATVTVASAPKPDTDHRLTEAPPAAPPDRLELFRLANERYFLHVLECSVCSAGGRGYGSRCAVGQPLWDAAQKTPMPWPWGD